MGMIHELEQLHTKAPFNKMVIAKDKISLENRKTVVNFCHEREIELTEWKAFEEPV